MARPRASNSAQLGFTFEPPAPAKAPAELAGLGRVVAGVVSKALKDDPRSRDEVAGALSALLDERVSVDMLNAYASEARDQHSIPLHRALALIAVTDRHDLLDTLVRRIGAALLVGDELRLARLGHLKAQRVQIDDEMRRLRREVVPIERGGR
ncbi:hypothetical protein [Sphingomonas panni]|uniref:hypothetical protein n=1 Tax=Sphingomonas panni TaxID=237612 RepID=UPI001F5B98F7|nr:hypothetical protein [Sphingomonas panni]